MTKLAVPTDKEVWEIWSDEDWVESFDFFTTDLAGVESPRVFGVGSSVVGALVMRDKNGAEVGRVNLSTGTNLTVDDNTVSLQVDQGVIKNLTPGLYDFALTYIPSGGTGDEGLIRGKRQVTRGVRNA